jgi:hypothetical protein
MSRIVLTPIVLLTLLLSTQGQDRVTLRAAKGGEKQEKPWAEVPASLRGIKLEDMTCPGPRAR